MLQVCLNIFCNAKNNRLPYYTKQNILNYRFLVINDKFNGETWTCSLVLLSPTTDLQPVKTDKLIKKYSCIH